MADLKYTPGKSLQDFILKMLKTVSKQQECMFLIISLIQSQDWNFFHLFICIAANKRRN